MTFTNKCFFCLQFPTTGPRFYGAGHPRSDDDRPLRCLRIEVDDLLGDLPTQELQCRREELILGRKGFGDQRGRMASSVADGANVVHQRRARPCILDRLRRDVLAGRQYQDLTLAVDDGQVPAGVEGADVAGVVPTVAIKGLPLYVCATRTGPIFRDLDVLHILRLDKGLSELVDVLGTLSTRIARFFILQHNVAAIVCLAKDCGQTFEIARAFFLIGPRNHYLYLHIQCVRGDLSDLTVNVMAMKVARVQIDSKPGAFDVTHQREQSIRCSRRTAMVF